MPEPPLQVLIVDDEPLARQGLARLVDGHLGFEVALKCGNGRDAVTALRAQRFGLMLLDVEMPELDGFSVLAELGEEPLPPVVFVTAYDQYAIQAFEAHALDYLLKPVDPERFGQALERVRAAHDAVTAQARLAALRKELSPEAEHPRRIAARSGGRTVLIPVDEIDWIQAAGNYVKLHVAERSVLHRETLGQLAERLDPLRFVRVHRSHLVQLARVVELRPTAHGDALLRMTDGTELAVSRVYREGLERSLGL